MKSDKKQQLAVLFDFFLNRKGLVITVFFIFLINSAASISAPILLGKTLDTFRQIQSMNLELLIKNGKTFFLLFVLIALMQVVSSILLAYLQKESMIHYQKTLFDRIIDLPYLQLIKHRTAYLQSRWGRDAVNLASFYGENLFDLIRNVLIIALGLVAALYISPVFSAMVSVFILITGAAILFMSQFLIKKLRIYLEKVSSLSGKVNETISGIYELKIMGFLSFFKKTIYQDIQNTAQQNYTIMLKATIIFSLISVVVSCGFFSSLIYFGYLIISNKITIGSAIAFMGIAFFIMKSLMGLVSGINKLNNTVASMKLTADMLLGNGTILGTPDAGTALLSLPSMEKLENIERIQLKNIWFKYSEDRDYVIRNFTYTFEKGTFYAISGKSGVGKTTLIKLLMGVIPPERGALMINEKSLEESDIPAYWDRMGYLSQDPFLFKGTLLQNLVPGADEAETIDFEVIKQALFESGMKQMDPNHDIDVEEGGKNFSGGERRRMSLARAFIKRADVLILDEPTSQIDGETEATILESIRLFTRKGKIAIMIAHSDYAISKADKEICLNVPQTSAASRKKTKHDDHQTEALNMTETTPIVA